MKRVVGIIVGVFFSIVILSGIVVTYQHIAYGGYVEPEVERVTLSEPATLLFYGNNDKKPIIPAGETISVLARYDKQPFLLVERDNGQRGRIHITDTDLLNRPKYVFNYSNSMYRMPIDQFYDECIGKSFHEFERKYRITPAIDQLPPAKGEHTLTLPFKLTALYDWRAYSPVVTYTDGVATQIEYKDIKQGSRLILKYAPLSEWLLRQQIVQRIISEPQFYRAELMSQNMWVRMAVYILYLVLVFLYMTLVGLVPVFLICLITLWRIPFKWASNAVLQIILAVVGLFGAYIWWLILMMEGYAWWYSGFIFLFTIGVLVCWVFIYIDFRCDKCRRVGTLERIRIKLTGTEYTRERESEEHYVGSHYEDVIGTIVEKTYLTDGMNDVQVDETEREDVVGYNRHKIYREDFYDVDYQTYKYDDTYRCKICGHEVVRKRDDKRERFRTLVGSRHNTTTIYHSYYPKSRRD